MKNRVMLIGSIGAGKSTLTNALLEKQVKAVKTQTLIYRDWIVDTPGEYTENPMFYQSIMATAMEVTHVFYIQDATGDKLIFPPGFSTGISKIPIGVITKVDHPDADVEKAIYRLKQVVAGGPIIMSSSFTGQGIQELRDLVACSTRKDIQSYIEMHEGNPAIYQ